MRAQDSKEFRGTRREKVVWLNYGRSARIAGNNEYFCDDFVFNLRTMFTIEFWSVECEEFGKISGSMERLAGETRVVRIKMAMIAVMCECLEVAEQQQPSERGT